MSIYKYNGTKISRVRWFASVNRKLPSSEQMVIRVNRKQLTDPWTDKNGRHGLTDEESITTWGLGPVSLFIAEALKIIDALDDFERTVLSQEKYRLKVFCAFHEAVGSHRYAERLRRKTDCIIDRNKFDEEPPYADRLQALNLIRRNASGWFEVTEFGLAYISYYDYYRYVMPDGIKNT